MFLEKIDSPLDLKKLSLKDLRSLAAEIRDLIIEVVSVRGGHLASSLGAVEICIALHYCLNTPEDKIIFDVGHQSYAHKILTGRRDKFRKLRTFNGISGFPNPGESNHDLFMSGHASTALSWALGIAEAAKIRGDKTKTIAVIGDGSLTGGMCFEALNMCGHTGSDVLIILNHNEMSIAPSVGALSNYLTKILSLPIYNRIKEELEKFLRHMPSFAQKIAGKAKKFEEAVKGLIVPGIFFEELGFRYFGPIDGNNLDILVPTVKNVCNLAEPRILHVVTKKGKGYPLAEKNPEKFHSAAPVSAEKTREKSLGEIMAGKLTSLSRRNGKIIAITAAMPDGTGLDGFRKEFPKRFFDVGIAEENAVGLAAGFARAGFIPVFGVYSTFLQRSFDQIVHDVGLQNLHVVFAVDRSGIVGEDGPTHHGIFDISFLRIVPNMVCMAPKDGEELEDMIEAAVNCGRPVSVRYSRGRNFSLSRRAKVSIGKAQIIEHGRNVCVIGLGSMVKPAIEACNYLKADGLNPMLINARFIKPLDEEVLTLAAEKAEFIISVEEGVLAGGFGSAVAEFYEQRGVMNKIKFARMGIPDEFPPYAGREQLLERYSLTGKGIYHSIKTMLGSQVLWQR